MRRLVLGTAGHIDHGKTSLVKALTGVDTDRLAEEKSRGISIALGFTHLDLPDGTELGFVDVPGHEKFVRTMIAGVSGIDLVLLVVAADEGVMPQTREHLDICSLLGVPDGLVVLTKVDAVEPSLADLAAEDVAQAVAGTFLEGRPVLRVSSRTGAGIDELRAAIAGAAGRTTERSARGPFRMSVDRAFTMKGFGTVVTGTASGGRVQVGDVLQAFPSGAVARVRGIQVHGAGAPAALAGQRTALNLPGVERSDVARGTVLAATGALYPSHLVDVELRRLLSAPDFKRKRVRFFSGTQEALGNLVVFGESGGGAQEQGRRVPHASPGSERPAPRPAQLRLESAVAVRAGDRFVLRTDSPMITVGGGRVLDNHPRKRAASDPDAPAHFAALAGDDAAARALALVEDAGRLGLPLEALALRLPPDESAAAGETARALARAGSAEVLDGSPERVISRRAFDAIATSVLDALAEHHRREPARSGAPRASLLGEALGRAGVRGPDAMPVGEAVLRRLEAAKKIASAAGEVKLPGHVARLDAGSSDLRPALESAYLEAGLQPPTVKEIAARHPSRAKEVQSVLSLLHREGVLVKVTQDLFFHRDPLAALERKLVEHLRARAKIAPLEFKELAGNISRKFMIPLLEHFDATRVTMRVGEERVLRKKA